MGSQHYIVEGSSLDDGEVCMIAGPYQSREEAESNLPEVSAALMEDGRQVGFAVLYVREYMVEEDGKKPARLTTYLPRGPVGSKVVHDLGANDIVKEIDLTPVNKVEAQIMVDKFFSTLEGKGLIYPDLEAHLDSCFDRVE